MLCYWVCLYSDLMCCAAVVEFCRTRLLRSLPKLDSSTAQQLAAFLAEAQQHSPTAQPASAGGHQAAPQATVSEEEQQWWEQAALAYSLLRQQADKVQQQEAQEQEQQQGAQ